MVVRMLTWRVLSPPLGPSSFSERRGWNWVPITRSISVVLYSSQLPFLHLTRSSIQFSEESSILPLMFAVPNLQMWKMRLKGDRASCPKPHSQAVVMIELKPRTADSRAHLFFMTPLCLDEHNLLFLLHNLMTLKLKCCGFSQRNEEPQSQPLELRFLG